MNEERQEKGVETEEERVKVGDNENWGEREMLGGGEGREGGREGEGEEKREVDRGKEETGGVGWGWGWGVGVRRPGGGFE